jgi:hypothetical protein
MEIDLKEIFNRQFKEFFSDNCSVFSYGLAMNDRVLGGGMGCIYSLSTTKTPGLVEM